ncbi:MAG: adenylate/guanylate cyclase domain-containing protein [Gammaproteobacteria bacterium]|nr:adenylate/guanylate cyclase domain-containing protein [Gammaproteobacteria bacterium]
MPKVLQVLTNRVDIPIVIGLFALALLLEFSEAFSIFEDETLSYRHLLRTVYGDDEIVQVNEAVWVVYTDEDFYMEYGVYPLRRTDLATIISRLSDMGAAVIGVDMLLDFNSAYGEDPALAEAFSKAGNILLGSQAVFEREQFKQMNTAIPVFEQLAESGYSNISSNSDLSETLVRLRIYPEVAAENAWPISVKAVSMMLAAVPRLHNNKLYIGDELTIQLDQFNDLYIDYPALAASASGAGLIRRHQVAGLSAADILFAADEEELEELAVLVKDKIVLIGEVAEVAHDEFETTVGNIFGVNIIASEIETILDGGQLRAAPFWMELMVACLLLLPVLWSSFIAAPLLRNLLIMAVLLVFTGTATGFYVFYGIVLSMSYLILALALAFIVINGRIYLHEIGQKAFIKEAFGQYLSPAVVSDLVKDPTKLMLGGEERVMTAFFSDIAAFSSFSEALTPTELVQLLNDYLTQMCNIIIAAQGTVDKFEGDAIIAFWGAPVVQPEHAKLACFACIDMNHALISLRQKWLAEGRPRIAVRMGVNTGAMVVGNMGSEQRTNYTMMGDAVNLASRLEGANNAFASDVMISEATYLQCQQQVDVRDLDMIRVVGKSEPIRVYQLLDRKNATTGVTADLVNQYNLGLAAYQQRDFVKALHEFNACLALVADDGPSITYVNRCKSLIESPPAASWDGVWELKEKGG